MKAAVYAFAVLVATVIAFCLAAWVAAASMAEALGYVLACAIGAAGVAPFLVWLERMTR